ncbi:MAG: hypothetical protein ACE5F5_12895 [Acidimicrobiia bacterium]
MLWEVGDVDGSVVFEYLVDAVVSSDGIVNAVDWGAGRVFRFNSKGELIGTLGRKGQGPGEFQAPDHVGTLADTLWVSDRRLNRVTMFSPATLEVSTETTTLPALPEPMRARPPAYLLSERLSVAQASVPDHLIAAGQGARVPILLLSRKGGKHHTIGSLDIRRRTLAVTDPDRPWSGLFIRNPLGGYDQWAGRPGGGMIAWTETSAERESWRIDVYHLTARASTPVLRATVSLPLIAATEDTKEPAVAALAQALLRRRESNPAVARSLAAEIVDEAVRYHPPFNQFVLAADGAVWMHMGRPKGRWLRIETDGTRAEFVLPSNISVFAVRGESVVFRTVDALGVHRLGLLRLAGLGG